MCFTVSYQNSMLTFRPYVWTNPVVDIVYDWIMRTCTLEAWFLFYQIDWGFSKIFPLQSFLGHTWW